MKAILLLALGTSVCTSVAFAKCPTLDGAKISEVACPISGLGKGVEDDNGLVYKRERDILGAGKNACIYAGAKAGQKYEGTPSDIKTTPKKVPVCVYTVPKGWDDLLPVRSFTLLPEKDIKYCPPACNATIVDFLKEPSKEHSTHGEKFRLHPSHIKEFSAKYAEINEKPFEERLKILTKNHVTECLTGAKTKRGDLISQKCTYVVNGRNLVLNGVKE